MSRVVSTKAITVKSFLRKKKRGEKIVVLTAYDALFARLQDEAGVDCILVGDSVGMVLGGRPDTLSVTVDEMIYHTANASRGVKRALLVMDMPFLSTQKGEHEALCVCGRALAEGHAHAVKIEGGKHMAATIAHLVTKGIPVMGHIGLTPQSIHQLGGWGTQGKTKNAAEILMEDALALQEAGCFSIVLEKVESTLAARISQALRIPTIGIGSGSDTDGQVLVNMDMLGLFEDFKPAFVRHFASLAETVREATRDYVEAIRDGDFPSKDEV
jgi:3-methyl-2-oxobutanoate hydroxymethyltransferase